ncbi:MAG: beta-ketoacyl-ACP synthase 3 [Mycobacteriales bacterium]
MRGVGLLGVGAHRPALRVDNVLIAERIDSSDAWIRERSGIVTRGVAGEDESVVDMAVTAGGKALAAAGVTGADVDLVLLATCSMPGPLPGGSPEIAYRLGAHHAGGSDIGAGCAGFTYALALAADAVRVGTADHVLVIGSEKLLPLVDPDDRGTAFLFGDGAGAAVVGPTQQDGIGRVVWANDGGQADRLVIDGSPLLMRMDGRAIYRWATTALPGLARRACAQVGIEPAELAAFVPHQANLRITESVVKSLGLPPSVVVARDVVDSGNTSAASIPLALTRLVEEGAVRRGDPVLLLGFGAGLTAAGSVVHCP